MHENTRNKMYTKLEVSKYTFSDKEKSLRIHLVKTTETSETSGIIQNNGRLENWNYILTNIDNYKIQ